MSEKLENHEINEQELEQIAGGAGSSREFHYRCSKCGATRVIIGTPFPTTAPNCCGAPMVLEDYA